MINDNEHQWVIYWYLIIQVDYVRMFLLQSVFWNFIRSTDFFVVNMLFFVNLLKHKYNSHLNWFKKHKFTLFGQIYRLIRQLVFVLLGPRDKHELLDSCLVYLLAEKMCYLNSYFTMKTMKRNTLNILHILQML